MLLLYKIVNLQNVLIKNIMKYGFIKVATAIPSLKVADCKYNAEQIIAAINSVSGEGVDIILFPELSVTGSTCGELFYNNTLLNGAMEALDSIVEATANINSIIVVGVPVLQGRKVSSMAAIIFNGELVQFTESGDTLFVTPNFTFGVEVGSEAQQVLPVSMQLAAKGADLVLGLDASPVIIGSINAKRGSLKEICGRTSLGYIYANSGFGESTTAASYIGCGMILEGNEVVAQEVCNDFKPRVIVSEIDIEKLRNEKVKRADLWASLEQVCCDTVECYIDKKVSEDFALTRNFRKNQFIPECQEILNSRCKEIFDIQVAALAKRFVHTGSKSAVVGISGGLDSTLALLVAVKTFDRLGYDRKDIVGITMPGFGTTGRTYNNALGLMRALGITIKEISIKDACIQHFNDIGHDIDNHNITYENSQARERTQILMDYANMCGGMVIGTGDMSELALGWATYNGDHMSMYGVNGGVPKTLVQSLVTWVAKNEMDGEASIILLDIVDTPISPELIPADESGNIKQKTEDLVGPYELHDFFLYHFIRNGFAPDKIYNLAKYVFGEEYESATILKWLRVFFRRFFAQQFKRNCLPDGPIIGSVAVNSNIPSDACATEWLRIIDGIEE